MTILSQVLNGVLLPFVLYFMLKLINNKALMGKHTNSQLVQRGGVGDDGDCRGADGGDAVAADSSDGFAGGKTRPKGKSNSFADAEGAEGAEETKSVLYSSLPSARSRMRVRSAARKSNSGRRGIGVQSICWKMRLTSSPSKLWTAKNSISMALPLR